MVGLRSRPPWVRFANPLALEFISPDRPPVGFGRQVLESIPGEPIQLPQSKIRNRKSKIPHGCGFVRHPVKCRNDAKIQPNMKICFVLCLDDVTIEFGFVRRISTSATVPDPSPPNGWVRFAKPLARWVRSSSFGIESRRTHTAPPIQNPQSKIKNPFPRWLRSAPCQVPDRRQNPAEHQDLLHVMSRWRDH